MPFFVSKQSPNAHGACRSLLQKAVRRGQVEVARQTARHLLEIGDRSWLRQRTGVIVFEECWPLGGELDWAPDAEATVERLARVAESVKNKDATGFGSLAYALANGDESMLDGSPTDCQIRRLAEAIADPTAFWAWAKQQAGSESAQRLVEAAQPAHRRGGWPWDQAFIQAAAYLAVTEGVPAVRAAEPELSEFPYWVALDRHTPQGKLALRAVAKGEGMPLRQLLWTSFYFEGARLNQASESVWFDREVSWRLGKVGLDSESGCQFWQQARPLVEAALRGEAEALREHVGELALIR
jgi:hypothetical protein